MTPGLIWLPICDSTNDEAWARVSDGAVAAVATDQQRQGRGRRGRRWHSPPGCGLYLSWIARPALSPTLGGWLPLMAAVAVAEICEARGFTPTLKWPNDVLSGVPSQGAPDALTGKMAGILCEARAQGDDWQAVIGVGLNLRRPPEGYPEGVPAAALGDFTEADLDPRDVADDLCAALTRGLSRLEAWSRGPEGLKAMADAWCARGMPEGTPIQRGDITGTFGGLDADGSLLLRRADGAVERVRTGEVDLVGWRGRPPR